MKRLLIYPVLCLVGTLFYTSCKKDEIGGTAGEKTAGEWYVTSVAVDAEGNVVFEDDDLFGIGHFHLDTYNTSTNDPNVMWIDDNENFYFPFKGKITIDPNALTFSGSEVENEYDDARFTITNGKIMFGAATTPSGMPADSIVFNVTIAGDTFPEQYEFSSYRIAGFRYTGLTGDE